MFTITTESALIIQGSPIFANDNSVRPKVAVNPNLLQNYLPSFSGWMRLREFELVEEDLKNKLEITLPDEDLFPLLRYSRLI